ncbi:MAG: DegT/DnrJ/EryC1/StrS family aminotransferase [Eubacterium sp.]|nr:DegT/DnrJ/EryC1/StrS family aminotransferase [Eubacterium sp.]MCI8918702.1 DegT/DnrJ/EryC1/StrS family aminotransferase [Eubacterium sp.]
MGKLALNGGKKVRTELFPAYRVIGKEEETAVINVLRSGILSKYLGCWADDFYGGPQVRALEQEWAEYYGVKHAVAVNSATSALYCAAGAVGLAPLDEVIVSPYTMCASATAPLIYNAVPVFADIEYDYYCLDPDDVEKKITDKTRAVIVVDLLGQPYNAERIRDIAGKYGLYIIEDNAQAPFAAYKNKYAGTLGDIGIFSLNYHKHIHCGEGGILVTNDDELAERLRLIRNHAEAVVENKGVTNLNNMIGFNMRMTEIEAAIAREQLKKLRALVEERRRNVAYLENALKNIPFLTMPKVREGCSHSYYIHAIKYDETKTGVSREKFVQAVQAELMPIELRETEGVKVGLGYMQPLYQQPLFRQKTAYGNTRYPFSESVNYLSGCCPVCEKVCSSETIFHELMRPFMSTSDLDDVIEAFYKVSDHLDELI